jgi:uncharacterized protein YjeT (DUF2065 family)
MQRTYWSLFYLAGYVVPSGLLLLLVPDLATRLLQSDQVYDEAPLRLAGLVLLALGLFIVQMIRHKVEVLYPTTLVVRSVLSVGLLALFVSTGNPFFAVVLAVVLVGVALTGIAYALDRRDLASRPALA